MADNILFEKDFPHPTSMPPGPASLAMAPNDFIEQKLDHLDQGVLRKLLHEEATRVDHLK